MFARANSLVADAPSNTAPYTLKGHFRLVLNQPVEGSLRKTVLRDDVWRSEISFPGYSEVVVRNGERKWVRRNTAFTPPTLGKLVKALQPDLKIGDKEKVEKITEETVGAAQAKCVKLKIREFRREVCLDAATLLPLRSESSWGLPEQIDYEGYSRSASRQFPTTIRLREVNKLVAEYWLDSVSTDIPDKLLFEPLRDATVWPTCDKPKLPVPVSTPDPHYDETDRRNKVQGTVALQVVVDEQGHTQQAAVTRSLTPGLDAEAKAVVQKWLFHPAMCGNTPIPWEMNIEVSFRLY